VTTENTFTFDAKIPEGPLEDKWTKRKFDVKLVNPSNRRKYDIIVVGTGLAGAGSAAALGELGYNVKAFTYNDSSRRAHSIAAQGGINATKNYPNDNDSVFRLFYDTVKGGDYRSREANVYRLAEVSDAIIDQTVAQGAPYAREYGGLLDNRSFGGAQVSRTFYARGQTGQQLLLTSYQALARQVGLGTVELFTRSEMVELVVKDGRAVGIVTRDLVTGEIESHTAHALFPVHQRDELQRNGRVEGLPEGLPVRQPVVHTDPSDVYPGGRRSPVEADADVRVTPERWSHLGIEDTER